MGKGTDRLSRGRAARIAPRRERRVVAVTGADGFLGRSLVALLEEDASVTRVVTLDTSNARTAGLKTRFYAVDLTHPAMDARIAEILEAEGVDTVAHLAGVAAPTHAVAWAHELESVGTMQLLGALRQRPVRRLVVGGTTLVYGPDPKNPNFLTEGHPLRGLPGSTFVEDKLDVERQVAAFGQGGASGGLAGAASSTSVSMLRFAPIVGPSIDGWVTRWLARRIVPTVLGFDPLLQFLHEVDAVAALKLAVDGDVTGPLNVVGDGVLPVSTVVKLAGRVAVPLPYFLATRASAILWAAHLGDTPPEFLALLRHLCVADGERARTAVGFRPAYTSREAILDFGGTLRLRDAKLLAEVA